MQQTLHLCISRKAHNSTLIAIALFISMVMFTFISVSAACQISNFLFLTKILHITRKQTISLTVGLVLHDRNPFYAKKEAIS